MTDKLTPAEICEQEWRDYPSQDNEGYQPDRAGFKCGFFAAWHHQQETIDKIKQTIRNFIIVNKGCETYIAWLDDLKQCLKEIE